LKRAHIIPLIIKPKSEKVLAAPLKLQEIF